MVTLYTLWVEILYSNITPSFFWTTKALNPGKFLELSSPDSQRWAQTWGRPVAFSSSKLSLDWHQGWVLLALQTDFSGPLRWAFNTSLVQGQQQLGRQLSSPVIPFSGPDYHPLLVFQSISTLLHPRQRGKGTTGWGVLYQNTCIEQVVDGLALSRSRSALLYHLVTTLDFSPPSLYYKALLPHPTLECSAFSYSIA